MLPVGRDERIKSARRIEAAADKRRAVLHVGQADEAAVSADIDRLEKARRRMFPKARSVVDREFAEPSAAMATLRGRPIGALRRMAVELGIDPRGPARNASPDELAEMIIKARRGKR